MGNTATVRVSEDQSLDDVALQWLGSAEAAFALAEKNGLSVTDELSPGQELFLPDVIDADIAAYYSGKAIVPALFASTFAESIAPDTIVVTVVSADMPQGKYVKASDGQTLFDIAVQRLGSAEAAYALAEKNSLSVTDELYPGQVLYLTDTADKSVASFYDKRGLVPSTWASDSVIDELLKEGIDYWAIQVDFIVS